MLPLQERLGVIGRGSMCKRATQRCRGRSTEGARYPFRGTVFFAVDDKVFLAGQDPAEAVLTGVVKEFVY